MRVDKRTIIVGVIAEFPCQGPIDPNYAFGKPVKPYKRAILQRDDERRASLRDSRDGSPGNVALSLTYGKEVRGVVGGIVKVASLAVNSYPEVTLGVYEHAVGSAIHAVLGHPTSHVVVEALGVRVIDAIANIGLHPYIAIVILHKALYLIADDRIFIRGIGIEILEPESIETAQSSCRANPQEAIMILDYAAHMAVGKSGRGVETPEIEALRHDRQA